MQKRIKTKNKLSQLTKSSYWAVLGAALFYAISLAFSWPNNVLSWDIFGYYLYLPAFFIHGDIGLQQPWIHEVLTTYQNSETFYQLVPGANGNQVIKYPVGWALLNLPFFFIGHLWALLSEYPADGFSKPYQWSIVIGSYAYVVCGLLVLRRVLSTFIKDDKIVALTLIAITLATNLLHATAQATSMSHTYLFTLYAVLLYFIQKDLEKGSPSWRVGVIVGLMIVSRNSEIVLLPMLIVLFGWGGGKWYQLPLVIRYWKHVLLGLAPVVLIQMMYWMITAGTPIFYSYNNPGEGFDWLQPHLINFLFSFRKGWLLYTPIMLLAFLGIRKLWSYDAKWGKAVTIFTVLNIYLLSTWTTWWYAASFGQRSMVQSYAVLAIPLAFGIQWLWQKQRVVLILSIVLTSALNLFQTWQYRMGIIDQSRMTQRAYIDHFWRTAPLDEKGKRKLLMHRSATAKEQWPEASSIVQVKHALQSFESDSGIIVHPLWKRKIAGILGKQVNDKREWITDSVSRTGVQGFKVVDEMAFSPAIRIPYKEITELAYAWVEASAWVKSGPTPVDVSLVVTFTHNGGNYHYQTADITVNPEEGWKEIKLQYLTPEVRNENDELTVYVWNRNGQLAWIDDVQVAVFEDINPVGQ